MTAPKSVLWRDLTLLIAVPLVLLGILAAILYLPRLSVRPDYDFIYSRCSEYQCSTRYIVENGTVAERTDTTWSSSRSVPSQLYYYDVGANESRALTYDEAARYNLAAGSHSPDGYTVKRQSRSSGFLFGGGYDSQWVIGKNQAWRPIAIDDTMHEDVVILGWVK